MAKSRDLQWNRHDAAQRQDARDPGRFWSRIDDWQSTPCRSILFFRSWPLYSPSKSSVLPLFFPIRGCIPPQRFLFHCRYFSSLCLSSATLVTECFLWGSCHTGCGCSRFSHSSLPVILRRTLYVLSYFALGIINDEEKMLHANRCYLVIAKSSRYYSWNSSEKVVNFSHKKRV